MSKIINYGPEIYPYKFKVNYSLISLPILLKMKPKLLHRLYFSVGVRFEKMFDAVEDFADIGGFYRHKDVSDKMPNLNYGIDVGIGNEIPLQKIIIIPEVRYVFEMRPFSYDKYSYPVIKDDFTNHTILFNIGIARKISWHFSG